MSEPASPEVNHNPDSADSKFQDLHSRQLAVYGGDTMTKIVALRVLILGLGGVGIEAAKNLALAGVHTISLYDHRTVQPADQGVNFAVTDADVGKNTMAAASARLLLDLNPAVRVKALDSKAVPVDLIQQHDCVIVTAQYRDLSISELSRINEACRIRDPAPASFLLAFTGGHFATVFADHGASFVCRDLYGRPALQKATESFEERVDKKGRKYTLVRYVVPEGLTPGALGDCTQVTFSNVKGLTDARGERSVNDVEEGFRGIIAPGDPKNTIRIYPSLAEQGFVTPHISGGTLTEVTATVAIRFDSFAHALRYPKLLNTDAFDWNQNHRVHATLIAMLLYATRVGHGHLPRPHHPEDAETAVKLFREWNEQSKLQAKIDSAFSEMSTKVMSETPRANSVSFEEEVDPEMPARPPPPPPATAFFLDDADVPDDFIKRTASVIGVELQPMACFLGAVIAQEVVKCTGKFTPIQQFLAFDYSTALPSADEAGKLDRAPRGDRYDNITRLYGRAFAERLHDMSVFMPGAGALGCEHIKNFALVGLCCGEKGKLTVTDNDRIEVSNLSRQFLFRAENVGFSKAETARDRARVMNPAFKVDAKQDYVGTMTEHIFDDEFWENPNLFVFNALDNIPTRLYVDKKCVFHRRVLVESGTTGTAGNVDIINPGYPNEKFRTTSYADGGETAGDVLGGIPMCSLRNFPSYPLHCILFARALFTDCFVTPLETVHQIKEDPERFIGKMRSDIAQAGSEGAKLSVAEKKITELEGLLELISKIASEPPSMDMCVRLAWAMFHSLFRDRIASLVKALPKDAKKANGDPFWSGQRRFPAPIAFDSDDEDCREFIVSATNLYACMFGVHPVKPPPRLNTPRSRWMSAFRSPAWVGEAVKKLGAPPAVKFTAVGDLDDDSKASVVKGEDEAQKQGPNLEQVMSHFESLVKALLTGCGKVPTAAAPLEFEKDDDDNFHIDFVAAAANLRCRNYDIQPETKLQVKLIAGKIIPAIATTTAAVCGLAMMEFFKVLLEREISDLRNGQIDLGGNTYTLFDREPPRKYKTRVEKTYDVEHDYTEETNIISVPNGHCKYDRLEFNVTETTTVGEFVDAYVAKLKELGADGVQVGTLAAGLKEGEGGLIWTGKKHANNDKPIMTVLATSLQESLDEKKRKSVADFWRGKWFFTGLSPAAYNAEMDDIETPVVTLVLPRTSAKK